MRILFTGGGTGGHFYPIISIASELNALVREKRLLEPELYYMAPTPYDAGMLFDNKIIYKKNSAGKLRRYFSLMNFIDLFKTGWGVLVSLWQVYKIYPDVVFGKGGYVSFPALLAAKILRIPVVIHESDTVPGRVNAWAGKFAERIALSWPDAARYFPEGRTAHTGNPVRSDIAQPISTGAREFLKIDEEVPVILVLGGSQGSELINEAFLQALPKLVERYVIIHQTGKKNFIEVTATSEVILQKSQYKDRYKPFDYLNPLAMRMAAGVATLVISRAGSAIFEIASWRLPAIIVPITNSNGDHQRQNAFAYAGAGGCSVIEEDNLTHNILISEINRLVDREEEREKMIAAAQIFYKPNAARLVAEELLKIALSHEIKE
jgi:UDP-N-acetylglucosamine--N-acetylmuramyl-(pentapeptide) pyrophosphoryl-undecaprenol N-acetylglucosamine transferase